MQAEKVDRRVQRTRELLSLALMNLIVEQGYESITVQNIIDRANLGRSTFYAHYRDKEDLLMSGLEEVVHNLMRGMEATAGETQGIATTRRILSALPMFTHAQEQYELHKAIIAGRGVDVILKTIQRHLSLHLEEELIQHLPAGHTPTIPLNVVATYLAGTLLNLLIWWLEQNLPYSPQRMDEIFQELAMPGVWGVLR